MTASSSGSIIRTGEIWSKARQLSEKAVHSMEAAASHAIAANRGTARARRAGGFMPQASHTTGSASTSPTGAANANKSVDEKQAGKNDGENKANDKKTGKDDAKIKAAWEFIKFVMSDSEQYFNSINTGYCPCTLSVAENEAMKQFWAENPVYAVPFNQLMAAGRAQELPPLARAQDFTKACEVVAGKVIQSRESTPEQGVEELKLEESYIDWAE